MARPASHRIASPITISAIINWLQTRGRHDILHIIALWMHPRKRLKAHTHTHTHMDITLNASHAAGHLTKLMCSFGRNWDIDRQWTADWELRTKGWNSFPLLKPFECNPRHVPHKNPPLRRSSGDSKRSKYSHSNERERKTMIAPPQRNYQQIDEKLRLFSSMLLIVDFTNVKMLNLHVKSSVHR